MEHTDPETRNKTIIVWEKKPTPKEKAKAEALKFPPTFLCGINSDTDEDNDNLEDFETELRKTQETKVSNRRIGYFFSCTC